MTTAGVTWLSGQQPGTAVIMQDGVMSGGVTNCNSWGQGLYWGLLGRDHGCC